MEKRSGIQIMRRLIVLVKPLCGFMALAIVMGIVGHLMATSITLAGGYVLLHMVGHSVPVSIAILVVCMVLFALFRGLLRYGEQACNHYIAFKLLALIRSHVFRALRTLCPARLEGRDKGDLISLITSDIELLEVFYAHTISPIMIAIGFSLIMCFWIGHYHLVLGLIAAISYFFIGVILPSVFSKKIQKNGHINRKKAGALSGYVLESLRGLPEILQYGQGKKRLEGIDNQTEELLQNDREMKRLNGWNQSVSNTLILCFDLVMLMTAIWLYGQNEIGFDGVLISTLGLMSSFGPVTALANLGSTLQNTLASGQRVLDILDEQPIVQDVSADRTISFTGAKTEHISFAYEQAFVLQDVSLDIPKESIVGILGKSGCGKSTLLKLLMRFWERDKGSIYISDTDINQIDTRNLRDMESYVTQDTHLFRDTIKNNIRIANLQATDEEIEEACRKASIHDFIKSLPKGYNTETGELGDRLSGGERQRLGLARALLHNADLMLLDEPTSNLDSLNEAVILRSLKEECRNKTIVLVSHRPSTLRVADQIITMDQGRMS